MKLTGDVIDAFVQIFLSHTTIIVDFRCRYVALR
jgi:hypothetical protein